MTTVTTNDGIEIFYKDWGSGQPIVFSHGWPLSADDWDNQMLFFLSQGYRVIAADRRGHGRSTQTSYGHDMNHYADDLAAVVEHLDLHDAIHVGHSTGGGEVVRYLARHGETRAAKAALISAVPPLMVQTDTNPEGLPKAVFDDLQAQLAANRAVFYRALPSGPFYGFNRPGVQSSEAIIGNWWRQGMIGGAKPHHDGIVAFSQTDFRDDLKKITIPTLVMHSEHDQNVPSCRRWPKSAELLQNSTFISYKYFPHGMPTTHADTINATSWPSSKPDPPSPIRLQLHSCHRKSPPMNIDNNDTAVVIIDPQNDVLSPTGKNWDSVGASVTDNNTVQHLLDIFAAARASDFGVFISPHYFYPTDSTWLFNGPLETDEFRTHTFARSGALTLEGFTGSGADWLEEFKPYIQDGKTVVASPHKVWSPQSNDLILQLRKRAVSKIILGGMLANMCVESHLRDLPENGFEVAVVRDATAGPRPPPGATATKQLSSTTHSWPTPSSPPLRS